MLKNTKWITANYNQNILHSLQQEFSISTIGAKILLNRGIDSLEKANYFFNATFKNLHNPYLLDGMDIAIERILKAFKNHELIYGFGDYDVDGLTSLSTLYLYLEKVYEKIGYIVPSRQSFGYGLNNETVDLVHKNGGKLIITVDCGVSNYDEIEYAKYLGIDVIVIDHHQIPESIPNAVAILNPYLEGSKFPFKDMAAVGVTFNLIHALNTKLENIGFFQNREKIDLSEFLDIVSIGTVADIVPLMDENRVFAKIGFNQILKTKNVGIKALLENANITDFVDSVKIGFKIAPKINAAGRMGDATKVVELLTTKDPNVAKRIVDDLERENSERQDVEKAIFSEILSLVESRKSKNQIIILESERWHQGVIGIVAAKLVERYHKPAFLFSVSNGIGRGSGRSVNGFDLYENLSRIKELFINYGGHKYAAGLSIDMKNYKQFKQKFQSIATQFFEYHNPQIHEIIIDDFLSFEDMSWNLYNELERFAPFGHKNPEPVFAMKNVFPVDAKIVSNRHLKLHFSQNHHHFYAIGFNLAHLMKKTRSYVDILFTVQVNKKGTSPYLQYYIKDLKKHDTQNFS